MESEGQLEEPDHWRASRRVDTTGLQVAIGLFWFEVWGLMGLGAVALLLPMSCFGDRFEGPFVNPCEGGPPFFRDGVGSRWLIAFFVVALSIVVLWVVTDRHRRIRGFGLLSIGLADLVAIAWVDAVAGTPYLLMAVVRLGFPAVLFVGNGVRLLAAEFDRRGHRRDTADAVTTRETPPTRP